jgi:hypothetical protein
MANGRHYRLQTLFQEVLHIIINDDYGEFQGLDFGLANI